jgi:hypothetical protein
MERFRTDYYVQIKIRDYDLERSSEQCLQILRKVKDLQNVKMTRVTQDIEIQGKIKIQQWYEMTGAIAVEEGAKAFWVLSKEQTNDEPYNFFMRLDRIITASDYETAIKLSLEWAKTTIIAPLRSVFTFEEVSISPPTDLSKIAGQLRG